MKGLQSLFLGIFGIFAFSWLGMTVIPNLQIGALNPQTDEDGGDVYPSPMSGMALRGAQVYAANGCVYCHSQQVRPDYGGSDLERKWGQRRSAPRDYIFEPVVMLGKMRNGPDLANVGHREALQEKGAASPTPGCARDRRSKPCAPQPLAAPALHPQPRNPAPAIAAAPDGYAPSERGRSARCECPHYRTGNGGRCERLTANGGPLPYTAAWHHRHLYSPRSVNLDSNMPAFRFLYEKRRISGVVSPDAINFVGDDEEHPQTGWEIVPSYDAKCLVAYLMSRDQTHPLKEAKSPVIAAAPGKEAQK